MGLSPVRVSELKQKWNKGVAAWIGHSRSAVGMRTSYVPLEFCAAAGPMNEQTLLALQGHIFVEAPPAHGKTTFMQQLALGHAGDEEAAELFGLKTDPRQVGVLFPVRLHPFTEAAVTSEQVTALFQNHPAIQGHDLPTEFIGAVLQGGEVLFLGDGLDEIADPVVRQQTYAAWARGLEGNFAGNRMFLTTRPLADMPQLESGWSRVELAGIRLVSIPSLLLQAYYRRCEGKFFGDEAEVSSARQQFEALMTGSDETLTHEAAKLLGQWRGTTGHNRHLPEAEETLLHGGYLQAALPAHPLWNQWRGSPFILQGLDHFLEMEGRLTLPKYFGEFFHNNLFWAAMTRWADKGVDAAARKGRELFQDREDDVVLNVCAKMAWVMTEKGTREMDVAAAATIIDAEFGLSRFGLSGEDILHSLMSHSDLLVDLGNGQFGFSHFSLQQWLASRELPTLPDESRQVGEIIGKMKNPWWQLVGTFIFEAAFVESRNRLIKLVRLAKESGVTKAELISYLRFTAVSQSLIDGAWT